MSQKLLQGVKAHAYSSLHCTFFMISIEMKLWVGMV